MNRFEDWPTRLADAIAGRQDMPFAEGKHDCCLAAADVIEAMTGVDLMADFRGRYRSAAGAHRLLVSEGKGTLLKTLISLVPAHGGKKIPKAFASKGDLVMTKKAVHDECMGQACGICVGQARAVFPGEVGWVQLHIRDWCAAFRI